MELGRILWMQVHPQCLRDTIGCISIKRMRHRLTLFWTQLIWAFFRWWKAKSTRWSRSSSLVLQVYGIPWIIIPDDAWARHLPQNTTRIRSILWGWSMWINHRSDIWAIKDDPESPMGGFRIFDKAWHLPTALTAFFAMITGDIFLFSKRNNNAVNAVKRLFSDVFQNQCWHTLSNANSRWVSCNAAGSYVPTEWAAKGREEDSVERCYSRDLAVVD